MNVIVLNLRTNPVRCILSLFDRERSKDWDQTCPQGHRLAGLGLTPGVPNPCGLYHQFV